MPKLVTNAKKKAMILKYFILNQEEIAQMSIHQIAKLVAEKFDRNVANNTLSVWLNMAEIDYLKQSGGRRSIANEIIIKNTQRIRMLSIIVKNLCTELGTKPPIELVRIIECIDKELTKNA